jgi:transaldolase
MKANANPVARLTSFGQSMWLDFIRREMITSGKLSQLIDEDHLRGLTSNPKIFEKAIVESDDYDDAIRKLALQGRTAREIYDAISIEDVQNAADLFRPTFDRSQRRHGFVSLEVSPHLAHDTDRTITEARRLWRTVDRPNLLVKVPGTQEGLPAIRQLIREGINVNVTLLFGLPRYREVTQAYISGLEDRAAAGQSVQDVASVASFFLSRIDVLVDPQLEEKMDLGGEVGKLAKRMHGQVAVASAKLAYQIYKEVFGEDQFATLAEQGARPQRVLWASTSTKNPQYSDVKYVEALVGPETVNTVPPQTLDAYRDHGQPAARLEDGLKDAEEVFLFLPEVGIDIDQVTQQLEDEGVEKFNQPFDKLLDTLERNRADILTVSGTQPQQ